MCDLYFENDLLVQNFVMTVAFVIALFVIWKSQPFIEFYWLKAIAIELLFASGAFELDGQIYRRCLNGESGGPGDGLIIFFTFPFFLFLFIVSLFILKKIKRITTV